MDRGLGVAITSAIIAAVGVATSLATTGYALSKGSPDLPKVEPPKPPPPPPPPPEAPPPPPPDTAGDEGVAQERRKRAARFGVAQTLLTSPLGGGADLPTAGGPGTKSLLGG